MMYSYYNCAYFVVFDICADKHIAMYRLRRGWWIVPAKYGVLKECNSLEYVLASEVAALIAANAVLEAKIEGLVEALKSFIWWADQKCPCHNEEPNPCTLCGASVENLELCKAADRTLPPRLLRQARAALASGKPREVKNG